MPRQKSDATIIRELNHEIGRLRIQLDNQSEMTNDYRYRAITAEAEVTAWKERFDLLLLMKPQTEQAKAAKRT